MKKILALILCLVMSVLLLVGCGEDEIGGDLNDYKDKYSPVIRKPIELDFYIIYEEGTVDNAIVTVERMINSHLSDQYKTTLDMHYLTASEYEQTMLADAAKSGEERADIVLVVGKDMFDTLYESHYIADITDFLESNKYGRLNTQISTSLLTGSLVEETRTTFAGVEYTVNNRYTIPNNHVIGEYEYIIINKEAARRVNYSDGKLSAVLTDDDITKLKTDISALGGYDADDCVKRVSGTYSDKAKYESQGYFCNIFKYPTVDADEAFMSSFAIIRAENDLRYKETKDPDPKDEGAVKDTSYLDHYDRCMEVIYALNTDVYFRNLLMYGVKGTNYTVDENGYIVPQNNDYGTYNMSLLHTGDVFKAYYSEACNWVEADKQNGEEQNKQSVVATEDSE